jgi:uncharacterized protein DUF6602
MPVDLHDILVRHEKGLIDDLEGARELWEHPTAKGDISEFDWCALIGNFLPSRYTVSKAKVIDAHGANSDLFDVVIHDRHFCPLFFERAGQRYIPAESVFAVFEAKQEINKGVIEYAQAKAKSARDLYRTNRPIIERGEERPPREPFEIVAGVLSLASAWSPGFGDPLIKALTVEDPHCRLDLGCVAAFGAFEAFYAGDGTPHLETSEGEGTLMFFLLRLFHRLQAIGSPMAIDLREYSRSIHTGDLPQAATEEGK